MQEDGRATNAAIAKRAGISPAACHTRVRRLFTEGHIKRVKAVLDPDKLDRGVAAVIGVILDRSTDQSFAEFEAAVADLPLVQDCQLVAGEFDYFLKVRLRDMAEANRFLTKNIIGLPGLRQIRTFFVIKDVKSDGDLVF